MRCRRRSGVRAMVCSAMILGNAAAQINLKGRVLEKANLEPVPNALVAIEGGPQSVRTDAKGEFTLTGNSSALPGGDHGAFAAPNIRGGYLEWPSRWNGLPVRLEVFNARGARLASRFLAPEASGGAVAPWVQRAGLDPGAESGSARPYLRYLRVTAGGEAWRFLLSPDGSAARAEIAGAGSGNAGRESDAGQARAGKTSAQSQAANVTLGVSADLLAKKTLDVKSDAGDLGDIVLDYPPRKVDTGAPPIYGAVRLFDGNLDSAASRAQLEANWIMWVGPSRKARGLGATPVVWKMLPDPEVPGRWSFSECCGVPAGGPEWGYDDLVTKAKFNDYQLHIEFNLMGTPGDADPSGYCNSGVYQENRYELQIETIPTPWDPKNTHGMGSIINEYAPPVNLSRPQGKWQAYDITFRNDRYVAGKRTEFARTTILWNGKTIHDNRKIAGAIACCDGGNVPMDSTVQGLKLQNEKGADVRFRNVWIKPLTLKDTLTSVGY